MATAWLCRGRQAYLKTTWSGSAAAAVALQPSKPGGGTHYMNVVFSVDNREYVQVCRRTPHLVPCLSPHLIWSSRSHDKPLLQCYHNIHTTVSYVHSRR